ncbi:hypothetical protein [Nakamurella endophytica]|uniref:Uncharacterized protein n=1 Tax=Nakamurella endophytica TaxID=1748367 RepID=A0A917WHC2_9ACTN|nr:hypothetical protein [Nakamurella endophytica]GGM04049.1 hypothetical protein GCM10011594_25320 [Nakamurella endophytica]
MTTPGPRPRRSWLSNFSAAMAPVLPEDDGSPIVRPRSVLVAMVLTMLSGLVFLFVGLVSVASAGSQVDQLRTAYADVVQQCQNSYGTYGSAVSSIAATEQPTPTPTPGAVATPSPGATATPSATASLTGLASTCVQLTSPNITDAQAGSYRTQISVLSAIIAVIGIAALVGGWFLRGGAKWSRRLLIAAAVVSMLLALLLQVSTTLTLLATFLLVVGILLTFVGKGGMYFLRLAARRARH